MRIFLSILLISIAGIFIIPNAFANEFGTISVEKSVYEVPPDGSVLVKLYGTVENPKQGDRVEFVITNPDGSTSSLKAPKTSTGYYETYINVEYADRGNYSVSAEFIGNSIGTVTFEVVKRGSEAAEAAATEAAATEAAATEQTAVVNEDIESAKYELAVKGKTGTLKTDKEHYVKKHPGDSITINVAVVIDQRQKSSLQEKGYSPDGMRMKFVKIFPQRVVIEDKAFAERYSDLTSEEQLQLRFITKHAVSLSDFLTSTGEVISREKSAGFGDGTSATAKASITLVDPLPGVYWIHADSKGVNADHLPYKKRVKDTSCIAMNLRLSTPQNQLPDCYQDPAGYSVPSPSNYKIYIDLDKNYKLKPSLSFVDQTKDPSFYVKRYIYEPDYKEWFDKKFPSYTIYEAIGISQSEYVETKYELAIQEIEDKEAAEAAAAAEYDEKIQKQKQERDRVDFNNNLYGFFFSPDGMKLWIIVGICVGVVLLIIRKRKKRALEEYEEEYIVKEKTKPTRKPAETRQTSRFCETCGNTLKLHYKFCNSCGSEI